MKPDVSVIIPTYNGAATIDRCLTAVLGQETPRTVSVHVVDSGSTDGTLEIVQRHGVQLSRIDPGSFDHGRTRREAALRTEGELLVFLVQDAEPNGTDWLECLIQPVREGRSDASFGRQVPRPDASAYARWSMHHALPGDGQIQLKALPSHRRLADLAPVARFRLAFFDDTCACIRASRFRDLPYEDAAYGEDLRWAARALESGYTIAYVPAAAVIHSHERPPLYHLRRAYADHSLADELFDWRMLPGVRHLIRAWLVDLRNAFRWLAQDQATISTRLGGLRNIAPRLVCHHIGAWLGGRARAGGAWLARLDPFLRKGV